jgi:16S rRNA (guanine(966)-N(2))-methyltransferase RsmD
LLNKYKKYKYVRPFSIKLRNAIFSSIGSKIIGANILDLFAGSGSCSFDSLSRGARSAFIVDNDRRVMKKIIEKTKKLSLDNYITTDCSNAGKTILYLHNRKVYYDLVFIDPPYNIRLKDDFWHALGGILCSNYIIVYRFGDFSSPLNFKKCFKIDKNICLVFNI